MEIEVTITGISAIKQVVSKKGVAYIEQNFQGETGGEYSKTINFRIFGKPESVKNIVPVMNARMIVQFDLESREYNGRWYTDAKAYAVGAVGVIPNAAPQQAQTAQPQQASVAQPVASQPVNYQPQQPQQEEAGALPF